MACLTTGGGVGVGGSRMGSSVGDYVREQLDRLALGQTVSAVSHGRARMVKLPPSQLQPDNG